MALNSTPALALVAVLLAGCESYPVHPYAVDADTNIGLRRVVTPAPIHLAEFVTDPFNATCRAAGDVEMPAGTDIASYVKNALRSELLLAGFTLSPRATVSMAGRVTNPHFTSSDASVGGRWLLGLALASSNGKSLSTSIEHQFPTSFVGNTACVRTAAAFMPAVQKLIGETVQSPAFLELLR